MYTLAKKLPVEEKFNLVQQIKRAALSLTNNIAEGHGRFHYLENIHFQRQARGSLQELIDDVNACIDEHYILAEECEALKDQAYAVLRKLNGYVAYLRTKKLDEDD